MAEQKKMNLMQLTFMVAVNMMGSGIIMLPTNMAQVGAISLLSWIVTAVGSMASLGKSLRTKRRFGSLGRFRNHQRQTRNRRRWRWHSGHSRT